jgi:hypothetical protein
MIGKFLNSGHKLWKWRFDESNNRVLQFHCIGMNIYTPLKVPWFENYPNCWTHSCVDQAPVEVGKLCTMQSMATAVRKFPYSVDAAWPLIPPSSLWEVFGQWGCEWIWKDLQCRGSPDWLAESIQNKQCIVVANGLYMSEL